MLQLYPLLEPPDQGCLDHKGVPLGRALDPGPSPASCHPDTENTIVTIKCHSNKERSNEKRNIELFQLIVTMMRRVQMKTDHIPVVHRIPTILPARPVVVSGLLQMHSYL